LQSGALDATEDAASRPPARPERQATHLAGGRWTASRLVLATQEPGNVIGHITRLPDVTLRNRVTPLGELVADPARGLVYGNRGCLHDADGRIRRRYGVKRWIACRLDFRGRRRSLLMQPGRYTELFFLDEATALAAGHRPCAECRRADYDRFTALWRELHPGRVSADAIDAQLHVERLGERVEAPVGGLPDGAFVLLHGTPRVVLGDELLEWTPAGYRSPLPRRARRSAAIVTPPSLVEILRAGWQPALVPLLHPTVTRRGAGGARPGGCPAERRPVPST
jgi:hypothetical protein